MAYDSIFIRDYVGETPNGPATSTSWTDSPDVICSGTMPFLDPAALTNQDNYNKGLPSPNPQTPLQNNFVYVRGINAQNLQQDATIYLYYVDTSIVLWPQNWKTLGITYGDADTNAAKITAAANGLVATSPPFGWTPPRQGIHYCLVAWVKNGPDQSTPPDLYHIGSVQDMGSFILTHPNVGWRNTIELDATQPTIENSSPIEGPPAGGLLNIGVQCQHLPTDGYIEFSVPGPDVANSIVFPKTKIVASNYAPTFQVSWPEGFKSAVYFKYYKGATDLPDGANIIPIVGTTGTGSDYLEFVQTIAPTRLAEVHHYGTPSDFDPTIFMGIPPSRMLIVGSVPFKLIYIGLRN